jgi:serine protease Do
VVDQLRQFGEARRGWLGVRIQQVTDDIAESLKRVEADVKAGRKVDLLLVNRGGDLAYVAIRLGEAG